jgi:Holliday junction resolvase
MSGDRNRREGDRVERHLVNRHKAIGVHAERYPLSGASRFRDSAYDVDVNVLGANEPPLVTEVKARAHGGGFGRIEKCLANYGALFLRRNGADPLILFAWPVWARIIGEVRR